MQGTEFQVQRVREVSLNSQRIVLCLINGSLEFIYSVNIYRVFVLCEIQFWVLGMRQCGGGGRHKPLPS